MHSWVTVPAFSHLSAQHLPLSGALMLQKERRKAAEEKMQPMQLIQCRDTAGFTVQGGARQGCTVPTQPRVRLSVRACPPRAAPGQAGGAVSGVWGL